MANADDWQTTIEDFKAIDGSKEFEPFRSVLDDLRDAIRHTAGSNDVVARNAVKSLLNVVRTLQAKHEEGQDIEPQISEIAGGNIQNELIVAEDLKQGGRDYIDNSKQYVKEVFNVY